MPLERELKLTGDLPDLSSVTSIAGHALKFSHLERQSNTYFDTKDAKLRALAWTLRLRLLEGDDAVFTLKGASQTSEGLAIREELEVRVPGATGLKDLHDEDILVRISKVAKPEDLMPLLTLETVRNVFNLKDLGELALDQVKVLRSDGSVAEEFTELELELEDHVTEVSIVPVVRELRRMTKLEPSSMGKFSRALKALGLERF
jgi:inorganic triphosphatase YgiF